MERHKRAIHDALALARLRESRNLTQQQLTHALDVSQANVSRIEHEEDLYISTLRSYVHALGGRLEVNAAFPEETVELVEVGKRL